MAEERRSKEIHSILMGEHAQLRQSRDFWSKIPSEPRCKLCSAPFGGVGGVISKFRGRDPWPKNPSFCMVCFPREPGGTEIELSMLFADIRGSTALAERLTPTQFKSLLNRFYATATHCLLDSGAFIDKYVGDEVVSFFAPGFSGVDHPRVAITTAETILRSLPDIPIGIGVHTGLVWWGAVGEAGAITDITGLGDNVNVASRLASTAAAGEVLVSEATYVAAKLDWANLESRQLQLKGREDPIGARVLRVARTSG